MWGDIAVTVPCVSMAKNLYFAGLVQAVLYCVFYALFPCQSGAFFLLLIERNCIYSFEQFLIVNSHHVFILN